MKIGLLLSLGLLAACARVPTQSPLPQDALQATWQAHRARLAELSDWSLQARVGIRTKAEGWSAGLHWTQEDHSYTMRLIPPLGQGAVTLEGSSSHAVIRTSDGKVLSAADPEMLIQRNFGWSIPVAGLKYWIRGIPNPDETIDAMELDQQGHISRLEQSGWRVRIQRYARETGLDLPKKLILEHERMTVRVAVRRWQI